MLYWILKLGGSKLISEIFNAKPDKELKRKINLSKKKNEEPYGSTLCTN